MEAIHNILEQADAFIRWGINAPPNKSTLMRALAQTQIITNYSICIFMK